MSGPENTRPRYDPEAERAVLGELLLDPSLLARVRALLSAAELYEPRNVAVFESIVSVCERGLPLDVTTLAADLLDRGRLQAVGGAQYLGELTETIPTTAHWEAHARIVAEHARGRRAREALVRALTELDRPGPAPGEAIANATAHLADVTGKASAGACKSVLDHAVDLWAELERGLQGGSRAVRSGLRCLDGDDEEYGLTGGLHPGQLWCLAAPPGGGKTALACQIAETVAAAGRPVLIVSQEMPGRELLTRLCCARTGLPSARVRAARFGHGEIDQFSGALEELSRLPLEILDSGRATPAEVRAQALRVRAERGDLGLVVVDYLQILQPDHRDPSQVRQLEEMTRALKTLPLEADCPLVLLSQFNREPARAAREPQLFDLRGSGSIENDADVVAFLHAPPPPKDEESGATVARPSREKVELIIAKHRQGATGRASLIFDRPRTRFEDAPGDRDVEGIPRQRWGNGDGSRGYAAGEV